MVGLEGFKGNPFPYYKSADLFAITSRWEGFGNVIVEALSVGTPVVACNCSGGPSYILNDGEYGKLAPVGDIEKVASAIKKSLSEKPNFLKLQNRGAEFSVDRIADRYCQAMGGL